MDDRVATEPVVDLSKLLLARLSLKGAMALLAKTDGKDPSHGEIVAEAEKRTQDCCILDTLDAESPGNCLELSLLLRMEDPLLLRPVR